MGGLIVVGPAQASNRIEENHHVPAIFDESTRLFDHHLCNLHMAGGGFVEGRRDHFTTDVAFHVSDFLGTLVDEKDHQVHFRVVGGDGVGDQLQDDGFTGSRGRNDQATLPLADGCDQIDGSRLVDILLSFHTQALIGVKRSQVVKDCFFVNLVRILVVDGIHLEKSEVSLSVFGRANLALNHRSSGQSESTDLRRRDVDIVSTGVVGVTRGAQESKPIRKDFKDTLSVHES